MLDDLIARLESATGPDRMADAQIHLALSRPVRQCADEDGCLYEQLASIPAYTASLDAALTLMPPGRKVTIEWLRYPDQPCVSVDGGDWIGGNNLALAICIAALRARAAEGGPL